MGDLLPLLLVAAIVVGSRHRKKASDSSTDQDPGGEDAPPGTPGTLFPNTLEPVLDSAVTTWANVPGLNPPSVGTPWNPADVTQPAPWQPGGSTTHTDDGEYAGAASISAGQLSAANYSYNYILQKGLKQEISNARRFVNFHKRLFKKIF